jgi:hypothetical protein
MLFAADSLSTSSSETAYTSADYTVWQLDSIVTLFQVIMFSVKKPISYVNPLTPNDL